jgi:hypothetical protein
MLCFKAEDNADVGKVGVPEPDANVCFRLIS